MGGCNLLVISGIDGSFNEFSKSIGYYLNYNQFIRIAYDRSISFVQNIEHMKSRVKKLNVRTVLVGWSIGAVAAAFLANCNCVDSVIMINAFFSRAEVLSRRNITCDEEVTLLSTEKQPIKYTIIAGKLDDKIPYEESLRIVEYYGLSSNNFLLYQNANHNLDSFPNGQLAHIINYHMS